MRRTVEICQTIELTRSHAKAIQQRTSYSNDYDICSCPAYDNVCNSYHKKGHFSKYCVNFNRQDIKQITIDESKFYDSDDEHLFKGAVTSDENLKFEKSDNELSIDLDTNGTLINFKIDSWGTSKYFTFE